MIVATCTEGARFLILFDGFFGFDFICMAFWKEIGLRMNGF